MKNDRYLIKVTGLKNGPKTVFIDNIVLEGNKWELIKRMSNLDYVVSLGIHESFLFERFDLVPECSVDFP